MEFKPADTYDLLLIQAYGLARLCNSLERQREHWRQLCDKLTREMMQINREAISAERDTNEKLTNALEAAEARIEELEGQLRDVRPNSSG